MALKLSNVKMAEQIIKIFIRGNHMNVSIVRKVSDSNPNPRGATPGSQKKCAEKDIWC